MALCRSDVSLKHPCEQKKLPWMFCLIQAGHWSLAVLQQPGVAQRPPSIDKLCLVSATQNLVVKALLLEALSATPQLMVIS